jgi:hypothetical protein
MQTVVRVVSAWQAQDALQQLERLKDLLEESAKWDGGSSDGRGQQVPAAAHSSATPPPPPASPASGHTMAAGTQPPLLPSAGGAAASDDAVVQGRLHELQALALREAARAAQLDVQVRALCAELLASRQAGRALGRGVLPLLSGIEARIARLAPRGGASGGIAALPPTAAVR